MDVTMNKSSAPNEYVDEKYTHIRQKAFIFAVVAVTCAVMVVVNISVQNMLMVFALIFYGVSAAFYSFYMISQKRESNIINLMLYLVIVIVSNIFIIYGGEDGVSPVWLLVLPACGAFIFGIRVSCYLSAVVFCEIVFYFHTEFGHNLLIYQEYTHGFTIRFPFIFLMFFVMGVFLERIRERMQQRTIIANNKLNDANADLCLINERLADLIEATELFTYDIDASKQFFSHNAQWCHLWGLDGPARDGKKPLSMLRDTLDPQSWEKIQEVLQNGQLGSRIQLDTMYTTFDGKTRWCRLTGRVQSVDEQGKPKTLAGLGFDITARKEEEQVEKKYQEKLENTVHIRTKELEKSREKALSASKAKSFFLSTVSHEMRTPMNAIIGFIYLFDRTNLTTQQNVQLDKIDASAKLLLGLINDVLDMSKIESGKMELERQSFDLQKCIEVPKVIILSLANKKGVAFNINIAKNVPNNLIGDTQRINQILLNLLNNAVKFTQQGTVALTVSVRNPIATDEIVPVEACIPTDHDGNIVLGFSIKDSGIGIAPERINTIFQPFMQADSSTTRQYGGTGLGLSICSKLAKMMGGGIHVSSVVNEGSVFDVTLRLKVAPTNTVSQTIDSEAEASARQHHASLVQALQGKRFLVVEDNFINQEVARAMLEQYGVDITLVANGQEALSILQKNKPYDCIFMDLQMPIMGGIEATQHIRDIGKEHAASDGELTWFATVPIIAMTANVMTADKESCATAGLNDYVSKPIEPMALEQCLERWFCSNAQA